MPQLQLINRLPASLQMVSESPLPRIKARTKTLHVWIEGDLRQYEIPLMVWESIRHRVPPDGRILLGGYEIYLEGTHMPLRFATHFLRPSDA